MMSSALRVVVACLVFAASAAGRVSGAIVLFEETFGTPTAGLYCDPAFPSGWTRIDADGHTPNEAVSYVDQAWVAISGDLFEPDNCSALSTSWYEPVEQADDWMITPLLHLPDGAVLSWRAFTELEDPDADGYEVLYSFSGTDPSDFSPNPPLFAILDELTTWTERSIDLDAAGLAGRAVWLAFRNNSDDDYLLHVDDVRVWIDDTVFSEEFGDDGGTGSCEPAFPTAWLTHDVDSNPVTTTYDWITSAWVAADTSPLDPSDCAAFSTSFYDNAPAQADDWLVTPPIVLPDDADLRWQASAGDPGFRDGYEVRYSCGGSEVADFTAKPLLLEVVAENASWTARSIDLDQANLDCQSVRFAFRNHSIDKDVLAIDSVEIAVPIVFRDGFESGYAGAWSQASGLAP
jgi:hypothetical protein